MSNICNSWSFIFDDIVFNEINFHFETSNVGICAVDSGIHCYKLVVIIFPNNRETAWRVNIPFLASPSPKSDAYTFVCRSRCNISMQARLGSKFNDIKLQWQRSGHCATRFPKPATPSPGGPTTSSRAGQSRNHLAGVGDDILPTNGIVTKLQYVTHKMFRTWRARFVRVRRSVTYYLLGEQ